MQQPLSTSLLITDKQEQVTRLRYEPVQTQGQCTLVSITPIKFITALYILFIIFSIIFMGIPIVFAYWYPKLKLFFYFTECPLSACTHFYIINYDGQITIVQRQQQIAEEHMNNNGTQSVTSSRNGSQLDKKFEHTVTHTTIFFVNRYMKYTIKNKLTKAGLFDYHKGIKNYVKKYGSNKQKNSNKIQSSEKLNQPLGLQQDVIQQRRRRYGIGTMQVERPTLGILFLRQVVRPLYFFIIISLLIWVKQNYLVYCGVIFFTAAFGITVNLYQTYKLNKKIHGMAYYQIQVNVLRNKQIIKISSIDIVPGDIVFLKQQIKLSFDAIILEGAGLFDECALTGQSVPIIKKAQSIDSYQNASFQQKNCVIFQGTSVLQVNNKNRMRIFEQFRKEYGIPVFVIRTNFVTMKGQLIRIISFPQERVNIFQRQSMSFLLFLFFFAVTSYTILLVKFIGKISAYDIVMKFFDLITITVPPSLPVSMTFGIIYAVEKLQKKNIYCVSPSKVISGGLVNLLCFDKTGTLTESFMDFQALVPCHKTQFKDPIKNQKQGQTNTQVQKILNKYPYIMPALCNMATNHSIVKLQTTSQNVGDPMEIKLFQFGGYQVADIQQHQINNEQEESIFNYKSNWGHTGRVYQRFDFDSELLRMSSIASSYSSEGQEFNLYCKGSPEAMLKILDPSTVPEDYHDILRDYTARGKRVLAIAHRKIKKLAIKDRIQMQQDLMFDGYQIFQNKLKPETKDAIQQLNDADLQCVMITGDNALTGSSIAYKCGIADPKKKTFIYDYDQKKKKAICDQFKYDPEIQQPCEPEILEQQKQKQSGKQFQMSILQKNITYKDSEYIPDKKEERKSGEINMIDSDIEQILLSLQINSSQICITGSGFNYFFPTLQNISDRQKQFLGHIRVFSRAKPNDKAKIIMAYQNIGHKVSMCGDGANDCGALKQADIGLSLSPAQASISAPFTSKVTNISSMIQLIKQCRAGLVTNFSLFDIMAMYSFIQYSSSMILEFMYAYPSDYQFVYWDVFGNFFFFITFGYTKTAEKLSLERPSYLLLSLTNIVQLIIMFITQFLGQLLMIYSLGHIFGDDINYSQQGGQTINYHRYVEAGNSFALNTPETNIIFLFTNFMYIFTFVAFSISKPWRKQFYTNLPFSVCFTLILGYSILITVVPQTRLSIFEISYMNYMPMNVFVLFMGLILSGVILFNQKCILQPLSARLRTKYPDKQWI